VVDPVSIAAAAAQLSSTGQDVDVSPEIERFVGDVTGSARKELGAWFGDLIRLRRFNWTLRACERAQEELRRRGRDPKEVRLNVLLPLLDAAAMEEDESMADRWAALLANAADPATPAVPPSFPEVLRQLTPLDAKLLDFVVNYNVDSKHEDLNPSPTPDGHADRFQPLTLAWIRGTAAEQAPLSDFFVGMDNLARLRLLELLGDAVAGLNRRASATAFGIAFMRACCPG
jgi:hypothetical protein